MMWVVSGFLASYLAACELRAPKPWEFCEPRWNFAAGILVKSPLDWLERKLQALKREDEAPPPSDPPPSPPAG
jgi:hypothetical protein